MIAVLLLTRFDEARAQPVEVHWEVAPEVPFSVEEFRRAVAARQLGGSAPCATISATLLLQRVMLRCDDKSRAIDLAGRRGADAARAAAVVLLAMSSGPPLSARSERTEQPAPERSSPTWDARAHIVGLTAFGVGADDIAQLGAGAGVDLGTRNWSAGLDLAADRSQHNRSVPFPNISRVALRASLGYRISNWCIGGGALGSYTWISRTAEHQELLWGAGPLARWQAEILPGHWLLFEAAITFFPHRLQVALEDQALTATPHLQLGLAAGYQWRWLDG